MAVGRVAPVTLRDAPLSESLVTEKGAKHQLVSGSCGGRKRLVVGVLGRRVSDPSQLQRSRELESRKLTKEPFVQGLQDSLDLCAAMSAALAALQIDPERCRAALIPSTGATDEVYRRVAAGEPFRSAYKAVASDPESAVKEDLDEAWRWRKHPGAPGALDLAPYREQLREERRWVEDTCVRLGSVWERLGFEI